MAAVLHDEGKPWLLRLLIQNYAMRIRLRLFSNDLTPTRATVASAYTEADFSGYSQQLPSWPTPTLDAQNEGSTQADTITYTHTGSSSPQTVYGWYLYDIIDNVVIFSQRLPSPVVLSLAGDFVSIALPLKLKQAP